LSTGKKSKNTSDSKGNRIVKIGSKQPGKGKKKKRKEKLIMVSTKGE